MPRALVLIFITVGLWAQERPIVLKASTVFDGKGKTLHNTILDECHVYRWVFRAGYLFLYHSGRLY